MKVLILNGSPRNGGNTAIALKEIADTLNSEGIETITVNVGKEKYGLPYREEPVSTHFIR